VKNTSGKLKMNPLEVVHRFFHEVWNERRLELLHELFDPNCVTHQVRSAPGLVVATHRGPAAMREHIAGWLEAFPDIAVTIDHETALGPDVVSWVTMRGRHRGRWQGVPSTNRKITIRTVAQHRVEGGRIVEDWVMVETLGLFQQLGLVPPTPELLAAVRRG
jgi:predicted ester cyclase